MMPKVSVIIPVFNVERYVEQAIKSIINQSLKDIEIIVVNDGSTDNSFSIINTLSNEDKRIRIVSTPNNGLSIARNLGLVHAVGEYIYFFDSDDFLEETALEECYLKCKSKKLDLLFFDAECFDNDGNSILDFDYKRTHKYCDVTYSGIEILNLQFKSEGYRSSACLYLVRKDYLKKENLFFPPRIVHEDELFTFFLYVRAEKVGLINKSFFHRRVRPNSIMTSSFSEKNVCGYLVVAQNLISFIQFKATSREKIMAIKRLNYILNHIYSMSILNLTKMEVRDLRRYILKHFYKFLKVKIKIKLLLPVTSSIRVLLNK